MKIAVVAPSKTLPSDVPAAVTKLAAPGMTIDFSPQCQFTWSHFAGTDEQRLDAFVDAANNPDYDVIWFARGGYGACRIIMDAIPLLNDHARNKTYVGYSDAGFTNAALYKNGIGKPVHGPMTMDGAYGSDAAMRRVISYLADGSGVEPTCLTGQKCVAFTASVLADIAATPIMPKLEGHVVMLEEVGEHLYALDRSLFGIMNAPRMKGATGVKLGRVVDVPENNVPWVETPEQMIERWCTKTGIPYLGRADIGHDADNKIVPFGTL